MNQTTFDTHAITRNAYLAPVLVTYGTVSELTKGGQATSGEGAQFDPDKRP